MHNNKRYLIVSDFDETLFYTSVDSPDKMNVKKAYELAIAKIFGELGTYIFETIGLHGRTPSELTSDILDWAKDEKANLIQKALDFFNREGAQVAQLIPESKSNSLIWNERSPEITITQMLVGTKLSYLINEIGKKDWAGEMWPRPCSGALEFMHALERLKEEGAPLDFAVLSSGHELFIRKSFAVWDLPQPEIIVTEDDIRPRKYPEGKDTRFKPGPFPIALTHFKWLRRQGISSDNPSFMANAMESKNRILCIGDDPYRDSLMAHRAKIKSYLYPHTPLIAITDALRENSSLLDGRSFAEIFVAERNGVEVDSLLPDNLRRRIFRLPSKERL